MRLIFSLAVFGLFMILPLSLKAQAQTDTSPGSGVWANYDFVPGHRVMAFHDFEDAYVGNFPDRITYLKGDMEVVELADGNKVLRTKNEGRFTVPFGETMPERFTVEFRVKATDKRSHVMMYAPSDKSVGRSPGNVLAAIVDPLGAGLTVGKYADGPKATQPLGDMALVENWVDVRIAIDKGYWKMYVNEKRVSNIPKVDFPREDGFAFKLSVYPYDEGDVYIDEIRIAEGGRSILYDELAANGSVITRGIFFDINSAMLRPESTPTLMDIATMLRDHEDLRLRIEGHTDNTGDAAINQPLSQQRAESVLNWLIDTQGIDKSRLEAKGLGAASPVAPNDTPEGRQENRRVELHRL